MHVYMGMGSLAAQQCTALHNFDSVLGEWVSGCFGCKQTDMGQMEWWSEYTLLLLPHTEHVGALAADVPASQSAAVVPLYCTLDRVTGGCRVGFGVCGVLMECLATRVVGGPDELCVLGNAPRGHTAGQFNQ